MGCRACRGRQRLVCPSCVEGETAARRGSLQQRQACREKALDRLQDALENLEVQRGQLVQLQGAEARLRAACTRVADLQEQLAAVRQRIAAQQADHAARQQQLAAERQALERSRQQTLQDRTRHMELQARACLQCIDVKGSRKRSACPEFSHTYLRNLDTLGREQRHRVVRQALEIFPLELLPTHPPPPHGAPAPRRARPHPPLLELQATGLAPQLGSALGYAALLVDLLGRFLMLPVLHRCAFVGAASHAWQPESFWDMPGDGKGGAPADGRLPLFWAEGGLYSAVAAGLSAAGAAASHAGAAGAAAAAEREEVARQRQRQQFLRALHLLQRSAGQLVCARLGPDAAVKLPPHWSPFAWLAGLCKALAAEPRGARGAGAAGVPGAGRTLAASAVFGPRGVAGAAAALHESVLLLFGEDEEESGLGEEGSEEWEVMPRPSYGHMIPPPPSQPEDVEHWTRAMQDTQAGGRGGGGAGGAAAAAGPAPPGRLAFLRSLTGRALATWTGGGQG
eukprot:scaffold12.g8185.t1